MDRDLRGRFCWHSSFFDRAPVPVSYGCHQGPPGHLQPFGSWRAGEPVEDHVVSSCIIRQKQDVRLRFKGRSMAEPAQAH